MTVWPVAKLGDHLDFLTSGSRGWSRYVRSEGALFLRIQNVGRNQLMLDDVAYVEPPQGAEAQRTRVVAGDVLLSITADLGRTAVVPAGLGPAYINQHLAILRTRVFEPRFLASFISLGPGRYQIAKLDRVGVKSGLNFDDVRSLQVPLPPMPEQRRIADILDKADVICRKRKEATALTEELLRSAFLDMVGPGADGYGTWPVQTVESLAADVPNSMRTGPFGSDLLHSEFVDEGVAVLGIDNAVQNRFAWGERRFITPEKYERLRRYTVRPGDVMVTIMGTTGRSAVVPDDIPTAITTKHLATITLDRQKAEPEFLSQALFRHPEVLRQIAVANRGAIMSGLNLGLIKALRIPIPPPERQREFANVTMGIRSTAEQMSKHRLEESLFNSLVARAFSGGLRS